MKKLILTSIALSISIMSACTPTPAVNGVNGMTPSNNGNAMGGSKVTKEQIVKYFDCLISKSAKVESIYDVWVKMPVEYITTEQVANMNRDYAKFGCGNL